MGAGLVFDRCRTREAVRIKRIMAWAGRELGGLTNQVHGQSIRARSWALSRGLGQLARDLERDENLQKMVQTLCVDLRTGQRFKKSIKHA